MADDARSDWLEIAKAHAHLIRASLGASLLLTFLTGLVLVEQRHQLREDEQKETYTACFLATLPPYLTPQTDFSHRSNACPPGAPLDQLAVIYAGFPHPQMERELTAWNKFAWLATQNVTLVSGLDRINSEAQKGGHPPFVQIPHIQSALRAITMFQLHLRTYTENFKVVEVAAEAGIPWTDLTTDKLVALMLVYQFEFRDASGEKLAHSLATPAFDQGLHRLQQAAASATGHPIALAGDLATAASLPPLVTLRDEWKRSDPAGYYRPLPSAEVYKLILFLRDSQFVTIRAGQNEDARLGKQMQAIREGTTDSAVNVPLLNLPLTLSALSSVSCVSNFVLLLWLYWHIHQMDAALKCYRAFAPENQSRMESALWGLPGLGRWCLPIRLAVALCLSAPILLGTYWRLILWWTDPDQAIRPLSPSLAFPAIVFLLAVALVREIQRRKSRALHRVVPATQP